MREFNQISNKMVKNHKITSDPTSSSLEENVEEAYALLNTIVETLNPQKRKIILSSLPPNHALTFEELRKETALSSGKALSTGSLHYHLKELLRAGFIEKTEGRPAKYIRSDLLGCLISLIGDATTNSKTSSGTGYLNNNQYETEF